MTHTNHNHAKNDITNIHIIEKNDTFYTLYLRAKKEDKSLNYENFKNANSHIEDFTRLPIGDNIYIPYYV